MATTMETYHPVDTPETVATYSTPLPPHYLEQIPGAICAVVSIAAGLLFVRFFVNKYILIPISIKYLPLPEEVKTGKRPLNGKENQCIMKLCKYFWHGFVYFAMTVFNVYIIATHDWALDIRGWTKVPTFDDDVTVARWFFWLQTGWYLHSLIESLWVDAFRSDFVVMLVHHLLAGFLVWGAWVGGNHRVGILITFEQDLSDIVLYAAKVYDKFQSDVYTGQALPGTERGHTVGLLAVAIAWIILRYGILGFILYAIYTYVRLYEWWRKVLYCFLISIWFMQIMWGIGLFKMVYDQLTKGQFHDIFHDTREATKKSKVEDKEDKDENEKDEIEKKKD